MAECKQDFFFLTGKENLKEQKTSKTNKIN